jgi:hypothetical protein
VKINAKNGNLECARAESYLDALRVPEVSELVEAVKDLIKEMNQHDKGHWSMRLESVLAKIEEIRK